MSDNHRIQDFVSGGEMLLKGVKSLPEELNAGLALTFWNGARLIIADFVRGDSGCKVQIRQVKY